MKKLLKSFFSLLSYNVLRFVKFSGIAKKNKEEKSARAKSGVSTSLTDEQMQKYARQFIDHGYVTDQWFEQNILPMGRT